VQRNPTSSIKKKENIKEPGLSRTLNDAGRAGVSSIRGTTGEGLATPAKRRRVQRGSSWSRKLEENLRGNAATRTRKKSRGMIPVVKVDRSLEKKHPG